MPVQGVKGILDGISDFPQKRISARIGEQTVDVPYVGKQILDDITFFRKERISAAWEVESWYAFSASHRGDL